MQVPVDMPVKPDERMPKTVRHAYLPVNEDWWMLFALLDVLDDDTEAQSIVIFANTSKTVPHLDMQCNSLCGKQLLC
jgi:superfamily II DNA/RNA helicase